MRRPGSITSRITRSVLVLLVLSRAGVALAGAGTPGPGPTPPPDIGPPPTLYATELDASHDLGDLGPIWVRELSVEVPSTLWFRWRTQGFSATQARYELRDAFDALVAQGTNATGSDAEGWRYFSLPFTTVADAPYTMHVFPQDTNGATAGQTSNAVLLNEAVPGETTCFTDAGLGLPIHDPLEGIRQMHGVPGLAAAVTHAGSMVVFDAVGVRSTDSQVPVTPHDKWHMGSITKSMTSTLLAILVQKYPFSVQPGMSIRDVFSDEAWYDDLEPLFRDITLAELVAQRSGIVAHPAPANAQLANGGLSMIQRRREYTRHLGQVPVWDPNAPGWFSGEIFYYHNGNFVVAAAMLEKIFGQPWEDLIADHLFDPLGMHDTGFGTDALDGVNQPAGHRGDTSFVVDTGDNVPGLGPAGTVHTTLVDLAKYARLHITGNEGAVVLTQATRDMLQTPYPTGLGYNWGFDNQSVGSGVQLWHNGSNLLWYAELLIRPDEGFAIMAATNIERLDSDPDTDGDGELNPRGPRAVGDTMAMLMEYQTGCPDDPDRAPMSGAVGPGLGGSFGPLLGRRDAEEESPVMLGARSAVEGAENHGSLWRPARASRSALICRDGTVYSEAQVRALVEESGALDPDDCLEADEIEILGAGQGGGIGARVGGVDAWVPTWRGDDAETVAALLAEALSGALQESGIVDPDFEAVSIGGRVVTPVPVDGLVAEDVGLRFLPEPALLPMAAIGIAGLAALRRRRSAQGGRL